MAEISPQTLFVKTDKGHLQIRNRTLDLPREVGLVFLSVDGKTSAGDLLTRSGMSAGAFYGAVETLISAGYISRSSQAPPTATAASPDPVTASEEKPSARALELRARVQATRRAREDEERKSRSPTGPDSHAGVEGSKGPGDIFPALELGEDVVALGAEAAHQTPPQGAWAHVSNVSTPSADGSSNDASRAALARDHAQVPHAGADSLSAATPATTSTASFVLERGRPLHEKVNVDRVAYDLLAESAGRSLQFQTEPVVDTAKHWEAASGVPPRARAPRPRLASRLAAIVLLVAIALPLFAILWLQFVPLTGYIPDAEQTLSQHLGQPVRISSIRYALLPSARLILGGVAIGSQADVRIERIELHASPLAITAEPKHFSKIEAINVVMSPAMLMSMPSWRLGGNASAVRVERLRISNLHLALDGFVNQSFEGDVVLNPDDTVKEIALDNDQLKIRLMPQAGDVAFQVDGNGWTLPMGPSLKFSYFTAKGSVRDGQVVVNDFNGRAAGGAVQGTLTMRWPEPLSMQGTFAARGVRLDELLPMLTGDFASTGVLEATGRYELHGSNSDALLASLRTDMNFTATHGELENLDLLRGFLAPGATSSRSGRTPFDSLMGSLQVSPAGYSYRQLRLSSGPFNANGTLDIARDGKLNGQFNAELVFETHVAARSSFGVNGTIKKPVVKR